jgi:ferredoxin-NADP reductase/MOSC domain-containing protein YiiM/ferredoxin
MQFPPNLDLAEPRLRAVNVGRPASHPWNSGTVVTAIWKSPVAGRRHVTRLNIDGDEQADKSGHGGVNRAVLVYQLDSYRYWQQVLGRDDFDWGQFGENFTVTGLADHDVCVGDRYRIGSALFEVTQPRVTCYRVGIRLGVPAMAALLVQHKRPGFYFRVLEEGDIGAGDEITLEQRQPRTLSVTAVDALLYMPGKSADDLRTGVQIAALSEGWRTSLQELLDQSEARADPRAVFAWDGFADMRVTNIVAETPEIRSIELAPPVGRDGLPPVRAGQYITIRVPAVTGAPLVRSYSLSSSPDAGRYRISVKREEAGQASGWLHASLRPGMTLAAATPRGSFTLQPGRRPILLISAGIGVTPVLAMLADLAAHQESEPVRWVQVVRTPAHRPFTGEVRDLLGRLPQGRADIFYTAEIPVQTADGIPALERSHAGRPSADALRELTIPASADAYLCGPVAFMSAMSDALSTVGIEPGHIHTEAFGPSQSPAGAAVPPHPPEGQAGPGPIVTFARSGIAVPFDGRFPHLLELAEACDVPVHWSCRTGVCQLCITPLLSGDVVYRPQPVDDVSKGSALICCSRPASDLVLDA